MLLRTRGRSPNRVLCAPLCSAALGVPGCCSWLLWSVTILRVPVCACRGYCDTDMSSHKGPRPPSEGARNAVILATMDDCPTGEFFEDFKLSSW